MFAVSVPMVALLVCSVRVCVFTVHTAYRFVVSAVKVSAVALAWEDVVAEFDVFHPVSV